MKDKVIVTTDTIFGDLGLGDSEEMQTRSDLMSEMVNIIKKSGLPQKEIAKLLEISAPKVSSLMSGKINDFSNDTLDIFRNSNARTSFCLFDHFS